MKWTFIYSAFLLFSLQQVKANTCTTVDPGLSYLKAKQKAELLNKKYVLYFKADWCTPCTWMEETTFQHPSFLSATETDFIFVKLDIDAFEGYALKQYFQVYSLPTTLVFNSKHEIINRDEGSLSADAFLKLVHEEKLIETDKSKNIINTRPEVRSVSHELIFSSHNTAHAPQVNVGDRKIATEIIEVVTKYGVQVGVFSSFTNARKLQDKIGQYTLEPVTIMTRPNGDETVYSVLVGKLVSTSEANELLQSLMNYGIEGLVTTYVAGNKS